MSEPVTHSKIVRPYVLSLFHLASVKLAIPLSKDMHFGDTMEKASENVSNGFYHPSLDTFIDIFCCKGRKYILSVPPHLRENVLDTAVGCHIAAARWKDDATGLNELGYDFRQFHWRSDGRIDGPKTAYHLVRDTSIGIKHRFYLACRYCLEDTVKALWAEMEEFGLTRNLRTNSDPMVCFWVERLRKRSRFCWRKSIREFFKDSSNDHRGARLSTFFPSLRPRERRRFLFSLYSADDADYLSCLYALTQKEEEKLLKNSPVPVLIGYLEQPMRSLFIVTVNKMWKYIAKAEFRSLLKCFFSHAKAVNFDICELLESFWNCSPENLRESVRKDPNINKKIDSIFSYLRKKRKAEYELRINSKKMKITET